MMCKARSMVLWHSTEHLMTFNQYKDDKTLVAAIQIRFSGKEAKRRLRRLFDEKYISNFSAPSTESLNSIFNSLQKIVSQLAILGENISQEDLNLKFLRSLTFEWNTQVGGWSSSSSSSSQNMAFVSSPSSTNKVNIAYGVSTANTQVSPANIMAIDGAGFDWSYMADDEVPTNIALIAFLDSDVHNDKTVQKLSKRFETLKTQLDD
ncbi:hypothetical protein Tco_0690021 [Tanacetum coccineum]